MAAGSSGLSGGGYRGWLQAALSKMRAFALARRRRPAPPPRVRERPRLGLALGGGFARGVAHIGVLRVLEQEGIPIDCIAGTSVGGLIAAMYAAGTPLDTMVKRAGVTTFKDFGKWTLSWLGLASNARLEEYLHQTTPLATFEEARIPLAIAATDLGSGEPVYFTQGEVAAPLRASCAYPGLFLPVEYQGRVLVDGFLAATVPVDGARLLGANIVVAVFLDSSPPGQRPGHMLDVIGQSFAIMQRHANRNWRLKADVVVEPDVAQFDWDDFKRTPELLAAGEAAARAALPRIRAALARGQANVFAAD
jgi:NTE family protein